MSVPKSKRRDGDLNAFTKAQSLFNYTYQITQNNFCKNEETEESRASHKWLCDELRRMCLYIVLDICTANKKRLEIESEFSQRIELQKNVEVMYERLLSMVRIAYDLHLIKSKRAKAWDKQIEDASIILRQWRKSDKERFKKMGFNKN